MSRCEINLTEVGYHPQGFITGLCGPCCPGLSELVILGLKSVVLFSQFSRANSYAHLGPPCDTTSRTKSAAKSKGTNRYKLYDVKHIKDGLSGTISYESSGGPDGIRFQQAFEKFGGEFMNDHKKKNTLEIFETSIRRSTRKISKMGGLPDNSYIGKKLRCIRNVLFLPWSILWRLWLRCEFTHAF
jgi:hypothetical protein